MKVYEPRRKKGDKSKNNKLKKEKEKITRKDNTGKKKMVKYIWKKRKKGNKRNGTEARREKGQGRNMK